MNINTIYTLMNNFTYVVKVYKKTDRNQRHQIKDSTRIWGENKGNVFGKT